MPQISQRSQRFTESVIRSMTRLADRYGAINLSQGFPDFDPPAELLDRLKLVADSGPHQYEITYGAKAFREALAVRQGSLIDRAINPETEIVVTCGATEAMVCAMLALINPGDKVGISSPFYENYGADVIISGAVPVFIPLLLPDYAVDWAAVEAAFLQGIKALVVCNPSNPCGKVFSREELMRLGGLARAHGAWIITDEVYEHIVYEPHSHTRLSGLPGMWENTVTVSSLSKTYSITGWRLGYLIGPEEAVDAARKVHDFLTVGAAAPLQAAALPGLHAENAYYLALRDMYARKRALFLDGLDAIGLSHNVPQGSYFVLVDIAQFLALPQFHGVNDYDFCAFMAQRVGVAAVPGSSFYPKGTPSTLIRLHFARSEESLREALRRLARLGEL